MWETDKWAVIRQQGPNRDFERKVVGLFEDLADATARAEASLSASVKQSALLDRNASWRSRLIEPDAPQIETADKLKVPYVWGRTTKGELSEAIAIAHARVDEDYRTGRRKPRPVPHWVRR